MRNIDSVLAWMIDGVPGAKTPADVVARLCPDLVAAGVPVDRCQAFVRTLHPHIAGRTFTWPASNASAGVDVAELAYGDLHGPRMASFAMMEVFRTEKPVRVRVRADDPHADVAALAAHGYTDFFGGPLAFISGQVHGIAFATKTPGGFSDDDVAALGRVLAPLSRVAEIFALLRTATNLLNTYVGHDAGARILAGQIQRGDTNSIRAVLWFSDLRGYTSMSSALQPVEIIATLNDVFDCQVPAIEKYGGEVLKFMGDGMFAIFPVADEAVRGQRCDDALAAAKEAFTALDGLNARRAAKSTAPVRFGVALHIGEIAYGNIGGSGRLDFTCIGPAVNLAARLETLTGKLGKNVVVSEDVAKLASSKLESVGEFDLKGVTGASKAFTPV